MRTRLIVTLLLIVLVMIFALQNAATVDIQLFFWQVSMPRSLLIFVMLGVGVAIGWFTRAMYRLSRTSR